jgi:hypothetical protein
MAKLVLNDITSTTGLTTAINVNSALIEAALENTLSRDGTSPNTMSGDLDMNSYSILNLPSPVNDGDPARKVDLTTAISTYVAHPITSAEIAAGVTPTTYQYEPGDVRRYGAVGNGTTDDTAALQSAISVACSHSMLLPMTTVAYKITSALLIPGTGATVIGNGLKSIIRQASAGEDVFTHSGPTIYNLIFRDVAIGVSGNIEGGTGFNLSSVSNSCLYNCQVIADNVSQGMLVGVRCYTEIDATQHSYINEFFGCRIRTAVSANARGYLFDGASTCSSNSHHIFGGECRADSGIGIYVPYNGGGSSGVSNQIVVSGVSFEGTTDQAIHITGLDVDQCCLVTGCRFEGVTNGVLFDTNSFGNVSIGNLFTTGLSTKVTDNGRFNFVAEPSYAAGTIIQLEEGTFLGQQPYTSSGRRAVFEILSDTETRMGFGGSVTGDTHLRIGIKDNGRMEWGSGSADHDVALIRCATGTLGMDAGTFALKDGIAAPGGSTGWAKLYVDINDGDLKVVFGDGTVKTIVVDT